MIWYVVTRGYSSMFTKYLEAYAGAFATRPRVLFYDQLESSSHLPGGTYIFADIERLTPDAAERAARVWGALHAAGEPVRLLNHPTRSMGRYELLRTLYKDGVNAFNVYRPTDLSKPERFPVFVRREDHGGDVSALLATPAALAAELDVLDRRGISRLDKLIVEFCDTSGEDGLFRKYGAFVVGEQIIPTHIFFSRQWLAKRMSAAEHSPAMLAEERGYLEKNPHAEALRAYARRAGVDYGRIDYGVCDGTLQVWEINTNPQLPVPFDLHAVVPEQIPQLRGSVEKLTAALAEVDHQAGAARVALSPEKGALELWARRGVGALPRRYQPATKRAMWRWYRAGTSLWQFVATKALT